MLPSQRHNVHELLRRRGSTPAIIYFTSITGVQTRAENRHNPPQHIDDTSETHLGRWPGGYKDDKDQSHGVAVSSIETGAYGTVLWRLAW